MCKMAVMVVPYVPVATGAATQRKRRYIYLSGVSGRIGIVPRNSDSTRCRPPSPYKRVLLRLQQLTACEDSRGRECYIFWH